MLTALIAIGVAGLLLVGIWQLWAGRLSETGGRSQLFAADDIAYVTRADLANPRRLAQPGKLSNVLTIALEVVVLLLAGVIAVAVVTHPEVDLLYKVLVGESYLVAAYLVGRGIYVRLGLPVPGAETPGDGQPDVDVLADAVRDVVGENVGTDFAAVHDAMATARGADDGMDAVTVALLAAARNEVPLEDVRDWAADNGVASPATVRSRAETLEEEGLLAVEDTLSFEIERLSTAEPEQIGTVASSVLAH